MGTRPAPISAGRSLRGYGDGYRIRIDYGTTAGVLREERRGTRQVCLHAHRIYAVLDRHNTRSTGLPCDAGGHVDLLPAPLGKCFQALATGCSRVHRDVK
jgi:hypothetical protein